MIAGWRPPAWFGRVYVVLVFAVFGWLLLRSRADVAALWRPGLVLPGLGFVLGWLAMAVALGVLWATHLRIRFGVRLAPAELLRIQALAWGGRYLPGKVGLLLGKLTVLDSGRLQVRQLGQSVLVEQVAFICAGVLVAAALLSQPPDWLASQRFGPATANWTALRLLTAAAAVAVFLAVSWTSERTLLAQRHIPIRRLLGYTVLLALHCGPHLFAGLGLAWLLWAAGLADAAQWPRAVAALSLANVAGVLAIFAPAGLGVREAVLTAAIAPHMALTAAAAISVLLRILTLVADALLLGSGLCLGRWRSPATGYTQVGHGQIER
jgi:hypothetical protein